MLKVHDNIPDKTIEETTGVTISAPCNLKDGGKPKNTQGIFRNIAKVVLLLSYLVHVSIE